jgi:hypothetical protein
MTSTPVPEHFKVTWSYSSLNNYDICPLKYWSEKVGKTAPHETNAAAAWGVAVHEALEHNVRDGVPMPANMGAYKRVADTMLELKAATTNFGCETKLAVDRSGTPCGWDSEVAYGRGAVDVLTFIPEENTALIVDYKTGKHYGPTLQAVANAWLVFAHFPDIETVNTNFAYIKFGVNERQVFKRPDILADFSPVQRILDRLHRSVEAQNFPAKKGFLCRGYCSNYACPHNGRSGEREY